MKSDEVVEAIRSVLPPRRPIGHHEPNYNGKEVEFLIQKDLINWDRVREFERAIAEVTGAEQVLATNSGTSALHLALLAMGIGPGDEVIVPALTFAATANAVVAAGAVPHFIDGPQHTRPYKLERYLDQFTDIAPDKRGRVNPNTGRRIRAFIAVDLLGTPADLRGLAGVAASYGVDLIEDAAESLGGRVGNVAAGNFGAAAILSFNHNKIVTTGGGGALLTNDPWIVSKAYALSSNGKIPHPWKMEHDSVGFNYAMSSVGATFGLGQLARLEEMKAAKRLLQKRYAEALRSLPDVKVLPVDIDDRHGNAWLTTIRVPPSMRDEIIEKLHSRGILARALFTPLHRLECFAGAPRSNRAMLEADDLAAGAICLPSGVGLEHTFSERVTR